jgi:hypothetical protein
MPHNSSEVSGRLPQCLLCIFKYSTGRRVLQSMPSRMISEDYAAPWIRCGREAPGSWPAQSPDFKLSSLFFSVGIFVHQGIFNECPQDACS